MTSKAGRWSDNDDRQMLLAIIQVTGATPDWKEVAPMLGKTPEAIRQRFMKIKKETIAAATAGDGGDNTPADPITPARKRPAKTQPGSTAKKPKGSKADKIDKAAHDANGDESDDEKAGQNVKGRDLGNVVKKEEVREEDDVF